MTYLKIIFTVVLAHMLTACLLQPRTESYKQEHISFNKEEKIQVYYPHPPSCSYEVIGHIEINGYYFSKASLFQGLANAAEELGAKAVVVTYLEQLDIKEYVGVGQAIRCVKS